MKAGSTLIPDGPSGLGGFSLIDLLLTISLLSILAGAVPAVLGPIFEEMRVEQARLQLLKIRNALIGDPSQVSRGVRTEFGYLGDLGGVPASLLDLLAQPGGVGAYTLDSGVRFGRGWNGPYLDTTDGNVNWTQDPWGTALVYSPGTTPATITSRGSDKAAGGTGTAADLTIQIPAERMKFTLYGFVTDNAGGPYTASAEVELNDLDGLGGVVTTSPRLAVGSAGEFQFSNVTMGKRSVTVYLNDGNGTVLGPVTVTPNSHHVIIPTGYLQAP